MRPDPELEEAAFKARHLTKDGRSRLARGLRAPSRVLGRFEPVLRHARLRDAAAAHGLRLVATFALAAGHWHVVDGAEPLCGRVLRGETVTGDMFPESVEIGRWCRACEARLEARAASA